MNGQELAKKWLDWVASVDAASSTSLDPAKVEAAATEIEALPTDQFGAFCKAWTTLVKTDMKPAAKAALAFNQALSQNEKFLAAITRWNEAKAAAGSTSNPAPK